jgi:hypothetical protein
MAVLERVRRLARQYLPVPFLVVAALAMAGPQCASGSQDPGPTAPSETDPAALLADSAIRYESSGGLAGFFSGASFVAKDGVVSVEYRAPFGRATAEPRRVTVHAESYLMLWKEIADSGLPSLPSTGEPDPSGADRIRNVFEVRRGATLTTFIWMDANRPAEPVDLGTIVDNVVGVARKAAAESQP